MTIDINSFDIGHEFDLLYRWSVGVGTESTGASAYAVFQDPLGAIALDLSGFYDGAVGPTMPSPVPVPAAGWLIASALIFLGMFRKRKRALT